MNTFFTGLTLILALLTLIALGCGIVNMLKTSQETAQKSNKLMRLRLFLQALTLVSFAIMLCTEHP